LHTFGVQFNGVFAKLETLLHQGGQFPDTTTLFTKDVLGVGGTDDDSKRERVSQSGGGTLGCRSLQSHTYSVRAGVTRTSTPAYPSSANSRVRYSFNSA
jgi:hypothetical protein